MGSEDKIVYRDNSKEIAIPLRGELILSEESIKKIAEILASYVWNSKEIAIPLRGESMFSGESINKIAEILASYVWNSNDTTKK